MKLGGDKKRDMSFFRIDVSHDLSGDGGGKCVSTGENPCIIAVRMVRETFDGDAWDEYERAFTAAYESADRANVPFCLTFDLRVLTGVPMVWVVRKARLLSRLGAITERLLVGSSIVVNNQAVCKTINGIFATVYTTTRPQKICTTTTGATDYVKDMARQNPGIYRRANAMRILQRSRR